MIMKSVGMVSTSGGHSGVAAAFWPGTEAAAAEFEAPGVMDPRAN